MYELKKQHEHAQSYIAVHDVNDPSGKPVGKGVQFKISTGLYSYWICSGPPETYGETLAFGISVGESGRAKQSNEDERSDEQEAPQNDGSHGEPDHESEDRGLIDAKRIDRNSGRIVMNMEDMGMLLPSK